MFELHQEINDITTLAATKAVKVTLGGRYMEGRALLVVERAESLLLSPTSTFELNIIADYLIDMCVLADVGNVFVSYAAGHDDYLRLPSLACSA